jgi:hypothetical protein
MKSTLFNKGLRILPIVVICISQSHINAAQISIANAGFESPDTAGVDSSVTDWVIDGAGAGVWNINDEPLGFWNVTAPEGKQVAFVSNGPTPGSPAAISQVLGATLVHGSIYKLSGYAGHPTTAGASNGIIYTVALLAGGNVLAAVSDTGPEGSMELFELMFDSSGSPFVGLPLEIRLASDKAQSAFDDLRLEGTFIPEPSASLLTGLGVCAARIVRRRTSR